VTPEIEGSSSGASDGTRDDDYTFGRPITTYLAPHQHLRVLRFKIRLEESGKLEALRARRQPAA
jgi:hypothetical protein